MDQPTTNGAPRLVGIDLGTTYSSVNYLDSSHKSVAIPNREGELLTPSVVYFEESQPPTVGRDAIEAGFINPDRFVAHAKRYLGELDALCEIDGVIYAPEDVLAIILRKLIGDAELEIGKIRDAVITVPAHYTGHQRMLTIQAGKQAGLENVNVVNEPVAAALAYILGDYASPEVAEVALDWLEDSSTLLIFDLGGGTFDLSIVQHDQEQLRVIGSSGDERLGGIDWDQVLVDMVLDQLQEKRADLAEDTIAISRLTQRVEAAKVQLSRRATTELLVQGDGWQEKVTLTRDEFERRAGELMARVVDRTEGLLRTCGKKWQDIEFMLPVGGASQLPMIQRVLERWSWRNEFIKNVSPSMSIAKGAALFAGMINSRTMPMGTGVVSRYLAQYSTTNVCSNNLGLVVKNQKGKRVNHVLIPRNTPLPASATVTVSTTHYNQRRASIRVIEGDAALRKKGKLICRCSIEDLPEGLPAKSLLDVHVSYDADGLLSVVAKHRDTGRLASVSAQYSA